MPPWTELREHLARYIQATAIWWVWVGGIRSLLRVDGVMSEEQQFTIELLARYKRERDEARAELAKAARKINCAGPVDHRIDVDKLREERNRARGALFKALADSDLGLKE